MYENLRISRQSSLLYPWCPSHSEGAFQGGCASPCGAPGALCPRGWEARVFAAGLSRVCETSCKNSKWGEWGAARRSGVSFCSQLFRTLPRFLLGRWGGWFFLPPPRAVSVMAWRFPALRGVPGHLCVVSEFDISFHRHSGLPVVPGFYLGGCG